MGLGQSLSKLNTLDSSLVCILFFIDDHLLAQGNSLVLMEIIFICVKTCRVVEELLLAFSIYMLLFVPLLSYKVDKVRDIKGYLYM